MRRTNFQIFSGGSNLLFKYRNVFNIKESGKQQHGNDISQAPTNSDAKSLSGPLGQTDLDICVNHKFKALISSKGEVDTIEGGSNAVDSRCDLAEAEGGYLVIEKFKPKSSYKTLLDNAEVKTALYVDVETTGLDPNLDKVIEISIVPFTFDIAGNIYDVLPEYSSLQDPGGPIPREIIDLTGITDEMVKGKFIDLEKVSQVLSSADLLISHNAKFDRPFTENLSENFKKKDWACSIADINWKKEKIRSTKLDYLAFKYGFFYSAHRAVVDCRVGIEILSRNLPLSGEKVLGCLLQSAQRTDIRIYAIHAPYEKKDLLKSKGYSWSSGGNESNKHKSWYIDLKECEVEEEIKYLKSNIYNGKDILLPKYKIDAKDRYSNRMSKLSIEPKSMRPRTSIF